MRIIAVSTLRSFWTAHPSATQPLAYWIAITRAAIWVTPADVKATFRSADPIGGNRVVFDIAGNRFRLVAYIRYDKGLVYIRFIGSHADYDRIDATTV